MAYDIIRPAAYVPDPAEGPIQAAYHALAFPRAWREVILGLYRNGKTRPERIQSVPIRRLNSALRAAAPDLISVATKAAADDAAAWLYTSAPYPAATLSMFVNTWLRELQPTADAYQLVQDAINRLDAESLTWTAETVDLLEQTLTSGRTAEPAPRLYKLLPDVIAGRIEQLPPYEHSGQKLAFRNVAANEGAELMSWPPLQYSATGPGKTTRLWHYSATIKISLHTVPFSPLPRIHLRTGIRRWVRGRLWLPAGNAATVCLLADSPWLAGTPQPARFATIGLRYDREHGELAWDHSGPAGLLSRLTAQVPLPDVIAKQPEAWISGSGGITAAIVYHTMMGAHAVGPGLMPSERQRLTEWAAQAMAPQYRPAPDLHRSHIAPPPAKTLRRKAPIPVRNPDPVKAAAAAEKNTEIAAHNAAERRACVAAATGESGLSVHVLYQTDRMLEELIRSAATSLGLTDAHREPAAEAGTWIWRTNGLTVRIEAIPLGALGAPLATAAGLSRRRERETAIAQRRATTRDLLKSAEPSQIVLIELEGEEAYKDTRAADPKYALRLGCADAGRVSQFLRPPDTAISGQTSDDSHRAEAAWAEGLRQIGMRVLPQHSLGDVIPTRLNQIAFWMVKCRSDGPTWRSQFTPVAVLIRPGQQCIMARSPDTPGWVPYPELLIALTAQLPANKIATRDDQRQAAAAFTRTTLYSLRGEPTLVLTHAQNCRQSWPWLTNSAPIEDKIQIGGGPVQRLGLHGRQLRLARVRESARDETPQWWAPKDRDHAGISKGLWIPGDAGPANRVFGSTAEKSSTHAVSVDATKLTTHVNARGMQVINAGVSAWNPELLELTMNGLQEDDDAEAWAMFVHQQRSPDDYRDSLALPLALHMAKLASEYALPHDDPGRAGLTGEVTEPSDETEDEPSD